MVGIKSLFIQGEFLRAEGAVQLNHLRKLQAEIRQEDVIIQGGQTETSIRFMRVNDF